MTLLYILYTLEKRHRSNSSEKKKDMFYIYIYKTKKSKETFLLSKKPNLIPFDSFSRRFVISLSKLENCLSPCEKVRQKM